MPENTEKLIRVPEVQALLGGISRSSLWRWEKGLGPTGFPKKVHLTKRTVAFRQSEIQAFLDNLGQQAGEEKNNG